MSKLIPGNRRHLTEFDRNIIEDCLKQGIPLSEIAKRVCKDPTTISREIKKNREPRFSSNPTVANNHCANKKNCSQYHVCGKMLCRKKCSTCNICKQYCKDYKEAICVRTSKAPFVCNGCHQRGFCQYKMYYYNARNAHNKYTSSLSESREGINMNPSQLIELDEIIKDGVKRGQSIANIVFNNQDKISCSERTIYKYINDGIISTKNIDLRRSVKYKPRKRTKEKNVRMLEIYTGRTYDNFLEFIKNHDISIAEMDTVVGCRGSSNVLLTIYLKRTHFMIARLLPEHTQEAVIKAFDTLEELIGYETFKRIFPLIITDNGSEFLDPESLEWSSTGMQRTNIYYCNPNAPYEKGSIEKNHEFIRYFVPKGKNFDNLTQRDIDLMLSNINNYNRESLGMATPYNLTKLMYGEEFLKSLNIQYIEPNKVTLNNNIFK